MKDLSSFTERPIVAPSILSADFSRLASEVSEVEKANVNWIHVDVMDGHFVPNITIGPVIVENLRPQTKSFLDCHLMVTDPEKWIDPFKKAGADLLTFHIEVSQFPKEMIQKIRDAGLLVGISLNPDTDVGQVEPFLDEVDLVLVMSVFPGFGGQKFIETSLAKVKRLAAIRKSRKYLIQIDGGISDSNAGMVGKAGCDILVAGSAVFSKPDRVAAINKIREGYRS